MEEETCQRNYVVTSFIREDILKLALLPITLPPPIPLPGRDMSSPTLSDTREPTWETTVGNQVL